MYFADDKQHKLPHLHAFYNEYEAIFDLKSGDILSGKFPPKETKLVQTWILLRQDELFANWKLAISGEPLYKIEPLR